MLKNACKHKDDADTFLSTVGNVSKVSGRSPDSGIGTPSPPSRHMCQWPKTEATPLQWRDRAGFSPDFPIKLSRPVGR